MGRIKTFFALPHDNAPFDYLPTYDKAVNVLKRLQYLEMLNPHDLIGLRDADLYIHPEQYDPSGLRSEFHIAIAMEKHVLVLCQLDRCPAALIQGAVGWSARADIICFSDFVDGIAACVHEFIESHQLLKMKRGSGVVCRF